MRGMYNAALDAASRDALMRIDRQTPPREAVLSPAFVRVIAANFCFFLTFASFFLLPLHIRALGGSERTIGLVMGTAGVAGLAVVLVAGWLLDRFGRRPFLLGGLATMSLSSLAFLWIDRIGPALFLVRGVQGLAFAAGFNAASTLAVELAPVARRVTALGLFGVSTLTTHAIAPALGEVLVAHAGFPALFVAAAACSAVGFIVALPLNPPPLHLHRSSARLEPTRALLAAFATIACCGIAFGSVITYVPTFVADEHLGRVGVFFLSYTTAAVLSRVFGGQLGDTLERRTVILPMIGLLTVSIASLAMIHTVAMLAMVGMAFGLAQGLSYPTLNAFAIDQTGATRLGRVQTLYNGAFNLGTTSGSMLFGPVVQAYGHRPMFGCAAGVAALAFAIFQLGSRGALPAASPTATSLDSVTTAAD
jgi:MFS family permease